MSVLEQLDLEFETEYSPSWIGKRRFDFYIKDLDCIIETHGSQHYIKSFEGIDSRALEEERINDVYKKETALQNGIKYYIELDCKESNLEWIKNSVLNSELNELFDLSNINWLRCAEFANKNIVKEVCDYWNNKREDETTTDVGKIFKLDRLSIVNYLKKGVKLNWCNYNAKEEIRKQGKQNGKLRNKTVEIFKNGESLGVFSSCSELERQSERLFGLKLLQGNISLVCNRKRKIYKGFTFKYVEEDNNLNISKIAQRRM